MMIGSWCRRIWRLDDGIDPGIADVTAAVEIVRGTEVPTLRPHLTLRLPPPWGRDVRGDEPRCRDRGNPHTRSFTDRIDLGLLGRGLASSLTARRETSTRPGFYRQHHR